MRHIAINVPAASGGEFDPKTCDGFMSDRLLAQGKFVLAINS